MTKTVSPSDQTKAWIDYLAWRSKLALHAYATAITDDHRLRSRNPYLSVRDVHAFLTQATMIARAFIPTRGASDRTVQRTQFLLKWFGVETTALQNCIDARNNLDHHDERFDTVFEHPDAIVSPAIYTMDSREGLEEMGERPVLLILTYIRGENSIVTYSPKGEQTITALDPIRKELQYIESRCLDFIARER